MRFNRSKVVRDGKRETRYVAVEIRCGGKKGRCGFQMSEVYSDASLGEVFPCVEHWGSQPSWNIDSTLVPEGTWDRFRQAIALGTTTSITWTPPPKR